MKETGMIDSYEIRWWGKISRDSMFIHVGSMKIEICRHANYACQFSSYRIKM
jgi:hypothetical protein